MMSIGHDTTHSRPASNQFLSSSFALICTCIPVLICTHCAGKIFKFWPCIIRWNWNEHTNTHSHTQNKLRSDVQNCMRRKRWTGFKSIEWATTERNAEKKCNHFNGWSQRMNEVWHILARTHTDKKNWTFCETRNWIARDGGGGCGVCRDRLIVNVNSSLDYFFLVQTLCVFIFGRTIAQALEERPPKVCE